MSTPPKKKSNTGGTGLSYREKTVDDRLDEQDKRISRLEKAALIALGYVTADAPDVVTELLGIFAFL